MKVKSKGEVCSIPHGLVVWSTGVGTRPVVRDFMQQIGQVCFINFMHIQDRETQNVQYNQLLYGQHGYSIIVYLLLNVQADKRVLVTDEWLHVKGCEDVYAIGDCASISQRKIMVC